MRLISTSSRPSFSRRVLGKRATGLWATVATVCGIAIGVGSPSANAQVSLTQSPNLPATVVINRAHCDETADGDQLFLRWILTGPEPVYDVIFRSFPGIELPSNNCPALTNVNVQGEDILSSPFEFVPVQDEMDIQFRVFTRELTSDDACTDDGVRDTQRTLCLYVADATTGLEEFRTQVGIGVSVDTQAPAQTVFSSAIAGDGRITVDLSAPIESGVNLQYDLQFRRCGVTDGGVLDDGGPKSGDRIGADGKDDDDTEKADDGGIDDGGVVDSGVVDSGVVDSGIVDAGIEDAGTVTTDAGTGTNDAGVVAADDDLTGPSGCGATADYTSSTSTTLPAVATGLVNGAEYEVRMRVVDDFGNAGAFSERVYLTPISEIGYMPLFEGGADPLSFDPTPILEGLTSGDGCESRAVTDGSTPFGALALLLFGLLGFRRRRRATENATAAGAALVLIATVLGAPAASADLGDITVQGGIGPYTPALDQGATFPAYGCLYKDSLIIPRFDVDVGLHVFDAFGSIQLNLGFGAMQSRGKAQPVGAPTVNPVTGLRDCQPVSDSATDVELTMLTLRPGLSYRADQLLDYFGIPLVPYGRVGVLFGGYAFTKAGLYDDAKVAQGVNPAGVRLGLEGALGLMLAMDWWDSFTIFSQNTTKRAQALDVFQHAFFYAEVVAQTLDTFGAPGPNLGPTDYLLRTELPVFFNLGVAMEF